MQQQLIETPNRREKRCLFDHNLEEDEEEEAERVSQQESYKSEEPIHMISNKNQHSERRYSSRIGGDNQMR